MQISGWSIREIVLKQGREVNKFDYRAVDPGIAFVPTENGNENGPRFAPH
jgi:hypothetical protein